MAAIGFGPLLSLIRFEYTTLALALVIVFVLVYRLGAGLHGLGRRGLVVILGGGAVLALGLAYAELLREYGTPGLVAWLFDAADWSEEHLGAVPRPMQALLGIPMLAWGVHLRARRRQGWWACAFGVTGMVPIAHVLADPALSLARWCSPGLLQPDRRVGPRRAADPGRPAGQRLPGPAGGPGSRRRVPCDPRRGGPDRCSEAAAGTRQRGRDSNPRLTSLPATAFKAVPIGHSGTPPCGPGASRGVRSAVGATRSRPADLDLVVGEVVHPLEVTGDVGDQPFSVSCGRRRRRCAASTAGRGSPSRLRSALRSRKIRPPRAASQASTCWADSLEQGVADGGHALPDRPAPAAERTGEDLRRGASRAALRSWRALVDTGASRKPRIG